LKAREAVAAVEFAFVFPIMLTLYLGSIELSALISVDQRITTVSGTVGDLASRANGTLKLTDLTSYFQAAQTIILPFSTTGLTQVVSFVSVNSAGTTSVQWSRGYNGGVARPSAQPFVAPNAIPPAMIAISKGSYVMVSETNYSYLPILGLFFKTAVPLYRQAFYLPRFASNIVLDTAH
jgi:Flp pilus assembly protein TadG